MLQRAQGMDRLEGLRYVGQARRILEGHADDEWERQRAACEDAWRKREEDEDNWLARHLEDPAPFEEPPDDEYFLEKYPAQDDAMDFLDDEPTPHNAEEDQLPPLWSLSLGHDAEADPARPSALGHGGGSQSRDTRREDTAGIPELVDWDITRALLQGAKTGGVAPRLREPLTDEDRDLLEMVLTGAVPTERRLHAAGLPTRAGATRASCKCPYCDAQVDEDAEHLYWWCRAWERTRAPYIAAIESVIQRTAGNRRIRHNTEWHKATRTTMIFPEDPELAEMVRFLEKQQGERRTRNREDWEGEVRVDELVEDGKLAV